MVGWWVLGLRRQLQFVIFSSPLSERPKSQQTNVYQIPKRISDG
jgi:hypothetical protein